MENKNTSNTRNNVRPSATTSRRKKRHKTGGSNKPRIGGTAVPGAKSTQSKSISSSNDPNQQQAESSNRDMRRRMQHLSAGQYSQEKSIETLQHRRKKRVAQRKQRLEEQREKVRKSLPGGKITLGRRNTYFLVGAVVLIVLLIAVFVVLRLLHILA
jgi:cobalamin biosynthesis Mg chelatase CobN